MTLPNQCNTDHRIELVKGAKPPAHRIYRMTPEQETELKRKIDKYLEAEKLKRIYSLLRARTHFSNKKDGTQRLCIDYRALNDITVKDVYLNPRIDEIIDKFAKSKYFSNIDIQQGYQQIQFHPEDVKKT